MWKLLSWILIASSPHLQFSYGQFCDPACLTEIDGAKNYAAALTDVTNVEMGQLLQRIVDLETKQKSVDSVLDRLILLEFDLANNITKLDKRITDEVNYIYSEIDRVRGRVDVLESNELADDLFVMDLSFQVSNLDKNLRGNVTQLSNQISNEILGLNLALSDSISAVNRDLNSRIDKVAASIPSSGGGGGTTPAPVGSSTEVFFNLTRRIDNLEFGKISNLSADNNIWRQNFRIVNATFEKLKKNNVLTGR